MPEVDLYQIYDMILPAFRMELANVLKEVRGSARVPKDWWVSVRDLTKQFIEGEVDPDTYARSLGDKLEELGVPMPYETAKRLTAKLMHSTEEIVKRTIMAPTETSTEMDVRSLREQIEKIKKKLEEVLGIRIE